MSKARLVIAAVITGGTAPDALRSAVENVRAGLATRAEAVQHSIVIYVMCTTGPNAQQDFNDEIARWGFDPDGDIGVCGDADQIAAGAQRWVDAGADTIVFQPTTDVVIEEFAAFIGAEVQPRIKRSR